MVYLGIDTNALLGNTLQIAIVVVVPFIIMGQVLTRCGGSDFFADLAASLMGHFRGGAAKIAVVGSAFFGMISGSAVANVASVGTITIPLMKRAGFPPHIAAGDRGGRLDRRADRAAGDGRGRLPDGRISAGALRRRDGRGDHPGVPLSTRRCSSRSIWNPPSSASWARRARRCPRCGACCARAGISSFRSWCWWSACSSCNLEAEYAALLATGVLIVLALVVPHKGKRLCASRDALGACVAAGGAVVDIIAITAIAGILIGAMTLTGVAFSLTQQLLAIRGGSLRLLLLDHGDRVVHPRPAAADRRRLRDPGDARRARAGAGRHLADAGASCSCCSTAFWAW